MAEEKTPKGALPTLAKSWERHLRASKKSQYTVRNYLRSTRLLSAWLTENGHPIDVADIGSDEITDWLIQLAEDTSDSNALHHYRNSVAFWSWVTKRERILPIGENPMLEVPMPRPDEIRRPPLTEQQVSAMLKACAGRSLPALRDAAIIRVLADTGMRLSGLTGLAYHPDHPGLDNRGLNDVFLDHSPPLLRIRLKGGRQHLVDIGARTTTALDRYLRCRAEQGVTIPALWVGRGGGGLGRAGVQAMLHRRAAEAGIKERVHPHRFRRTMATWHLGAGGTRDALMARAGWSSSQMINLYVSESRDRLAWQESQALGIADRF